jgi:aspartate aminotransferase
MTAMPALSPRMSGIHASPASILRRRARELRAAGRDIIELSSGNLDFATPDHVIAAAHAAALRGETRYTDVDGTPELKQAVRAALLRDHHLTYAQDEIVICNGSTQGAVQCAAGDAGTGEGGDRPSALLGALPRSGAVDRRHAGDRALPAEQWL